MLNLEERYFVNTQTLTVNKAYPSDESGYLSSETLSSKRVDLELKKSILSSVQQE